MSSIGSIGPLECVYSEIVSSISSNSLLALSASHSGRRFRMDSILDNCLFTVTLSEGVVRPNSLSHLFDYYDKGDGWM